MVSAMKISLVGLSEKSIRVVVQRCAHHELVVNMLKHHAEVIRLRLRPVLRRLFKRLATGGYN
jgi:hypothetical protein